MCDRDNNAKHKMGDVLCRCTNVAIRLLGEGLAESPERYPIPGEFTLRVVAQWPDQREPWRVLISATVNNCTVSEVVRIDRGPLSVVESYKSIAAKLWAEYLRRNEPEFCAAMLAKDGEQ